MGIKLGDISPIGGAITGKGMFGKGLSKLADSGMGMLVPMSYLAQSQRDKKARKRDGTPEDKQPTGMKRGGKVKKMAKGGKLPDLTGDGKVTRADVLKGRGVKGFAKGGKTMSAKAAVHKHEKAMHKGKPLTKMAKGGKVTRADGICNKGHTKGRMV